MNMNMITLAQWIGAIGIGLFEPVQSWRIFLNRNPVGLSFIAFSVMTVGVAGYLALGIRLQTPIYYGLNISNLIFDFLLIGLMWFYSLSLPKTERATGLFILFVGFSSLVTVNLWARGIAPTISGWIGFAGIIGFYPLQNGKLFLTRDPTGLSLTAFIFLFIGLCGLTVFGFLIDDITIILGNGLPALATLLIIYGIVFWRKK